MMLSDTSRYYDKIYGLKNYEQEADGLMRVMSEHGASGGRLLDVACGTGRHIEFFKKRYAVEGLDISETLLGLARARNPDVRFHRADMMSFDLNSHFDVVTCLFSSIGYVRTVSGLTRAIQAMAAHLQPGGILLLEPWFTPQEWRSGTVHAQFVNEPELKIARINTSATEGSVSLMEMHYVIGTPSGTAKSKTP
jgi:SAM-dependent methyltransferase